MLINLFHYILHEKAQGKQTLWLNKAVCSSLQYGKNLLVCCIFSQVDFLRYNKSHIIIIKSKRTLSAMHISAKNLLYFKIS